MNIKYIQGVIINVVNITITFDDDTTNIYKLAEGDTATISYLTEGEIKAVTGVVKKIYATEQLNPESLLACTGYTNTPGPKIALDCSTANNSNIVYIYTSTIRGVNDTSTKYQEAEPTTTTTSTTETTTIKDGYNQPYDPNNPGTYPNNTSSSGTTSTSN